MLKPNTIKRINELVSSRMPQFDVALKKDIGKITQDLITRGLYNTTVQIGDNRAAAETNLDNRAKAIKASIQEVCKAHGVRYEPSLHSELGQIFKQLFKSQLIIVNARYNSNIPVENRRLCPIADLNPNVYSHEQEIQLFAESLTGKETTRYDDLIKLIKNNKIVCIVLVICAIIIALGVFTDALTKISAFFHLTEPETKLDEPVEKVTYNTYINQYLREIRYNNIVSESTLNTFFLRYQMACSQFLQSIPAKLLEGLPGYLRMPYDMSVVVSRCHGVGVEFTVPSEVPEIILSHTSAPIEKYYLTKYTNHPDFPKSVINIRIKAKAKGALLMMPDIVSGNEAILVEDGADVQLVDLALRYSKEEDPKIINYLWLFGSNSKEYWKTLDPVKLAEKNTLGLIKMYNIHFAIKRRQ